MLSYKWDVAVELRTLREEMIWEAPCQQKGACKKEVGMSEMEIIAAKFRGFHLENRKKGHNKPRSMSDLEELEKSRKQILP